MKLLSKRYPDVYCDIIGTLRQIELQRSSAPKKPPYVPTQVQVGYVLARCDRVVLLVGQGEAPHLHRWDVVAQQTDKGGEGHLLDRVQLV